MKIYDCFTFNHELDLLEIRLNILNDYVDYFVLVEATKKHNGEEKELYFEKNKNRFHEFSKKIIHIIVDDMPEIKKGNRWELENFQRNAIMRGLLNCKDDDIIIISDLDEIPNLEKNDIKDNLKHSKESDFLYNIYIDIKKYFLSLKSENKILKIIKKTITHFSIYINRLVIYKQNVYYYHINGFVNDHWLKSKALLYKDLVKEYNSSPQQVRDNSLSKKIVSNGGWHFSYLFSPEMISEKIKTYAHSEFDKPEYTNINLIQEKIKNGENLFNKESHVQNVPIDNSYPKYILENLNKYDLYINHTRTSHQTNN